MHRLQGLIDDIKARNMTQMYSDAQSRLHAFSSFLKCIHSKLSGFSPSVSAKFPPAIKIEQTIAKRGIVMIDTISLSNGELFKMLLKHLSILLRLLFATCFSDINMCGYEDALLSYVTSSNKRFIVSSRDIVADTSTKFQAASSNLDRISRLRRRFIYFRHTANSEAIAKKLGTYERWNISYKWDANHTIIIPDFSVGKVAIRTTAYRIQPQIM